MYYLENVKKRLLNVFIFFSSKKQQTDIRLRYCLWPWLSLSRRPPRGLTPFNGAQNET